MNVDFGEAITRVKNVVKAIEQDERDKRYDSALKYIDEALSLLQQARFGVQQEKEDAEG